MFYRSMAIEKGRGATLNGDSRRFNLPQRQADGDWLDAVEHLDGPIPRRRTQVTIEHPRTILTRNASPDIGFPNRSMPIAAATSTSTVVQYD